MYKRTRRSGNRNGKGDGLCEKSKGEGKPGRLRINRKPRVGGTEKGGKGLTVSGPVPGDDIRGLRQKERVPYIRDRLVLAKTPSVVVDTT